MYGLQAAFGPGQCYRPSQNKLDTLLRRLHQHENKPALQALWKHLYGRN